jgi:hypothetical protein
MDAWFCQFDWVSVGEVFPTVRGVAYFSSMKKRLAIIASVLSFALQAPMSADGVEFGQDATGDPTAVHFQGNSSGFLYSERIILTAAHVLSQLRIQPNGDTDGFVYAPGLADKTNAKRYRVIKAFIPKTYINGDPSKEIQPIDDFAIVVLEEDMPVKVKVEIATEAQMIDFAKRNIKIEMVGYGLQNGSQRINSMMDQNRAPHKLVSYLYTPEMMVDFHTREFQVPFWKKVEWGAIHKQEYGSICNQDSGSGFYVEEKNVRYYVGTAANGNGISNCIADGSVRFAKNGGMSWFPAPYKFLDLLKSAESFVSEQRKNESAKLEEARVAAELKAKQEADERARIEAELKAKLEAEAKLAAEVAAKAASDAALLAATKKSQDLAKKLNVGKSCTKLKSTKAVSGVKFVCVKKGKKLVWALS